MAISLPRDANRIPMIGGVSTTDYLTPVSIAVDPITHQVQISTAPPSTTFFAVITASSSGATQLVASVANKQIKVLSYVLIANGAVNVKFQSHVAPTDLTGLLYLAANTGASAGPSQYGHFQTVSGEALDINLSGNVAVGGHLTYTTV